MFRPEIPGIDERVDVEGNYDTFATTTGSLPKCRRCGALVGDKALHDKDHDRRERVMAQVLRRVLRWAP